MNNKLIVKLILLIGFSGNMVPLHAQQRGEVQDQEFVIRKDRVLTLPKQPRNFERIPVLPTPKSSSNFSYEVKPFSLNLPPLEIKPEAAQKQFPRSREELYPGFARVGYGNYTSPLLELRYNNWEQVDYNFGVKLKHQGFYTGPVDGSNSAENHTEFGLDGILFRDFFQVNGGVEYQRDKYNFYGYDPENLFLQDYIPSENIFNTFRLNAGIENIEKMSDINYKGQLTIRGFRDNFEARENELALNGNADFWFNDELKTVVNLNLSITKPTDVFYSDINRNYFKINPFVEYRNEGLMVHAGANMILENDVSNLGKSNFHIFPSLSASYMIQDEFGIYAGFEGDVIRKTYLDFVRENPFLGPSERLLNTIQNYQASAGVKGTINTELSYRAGVKVGKFQNMHFFANSESDSLKFALLYDSDTRLINYEASLNWQFEKTYRLLASVNYYQYSLGTIALPYQRPEWELTLNNNFTPTEKWLLQANVNLMGGIQGYNFQSDIAETLPAIIDLQVKADYQITDRISGFVIGNNLLNRNNQRFLNYPVRGIQGIVGATVKF